MTGTTETVKLPWLLQLEEMAARDDLDAVEQDTLGYVRELLLAPDKDDLDEQATAHALQAVQTYYRQTFCLADDPFWRNYDPADRTLIVIGAILRHIFEVVEFVPFDDTRNKRLADLVIGLKMQAPEKFDPEDPHLGWHEGAYDEQMRDAWNGSAFLPRDSVDSCNIKVNTRTFLARLAPRGMLGEGEVGALTAMDALRRGLVKPATPGWTPLVRRAAAVIATQFVLLAGEYVAKYAKDEQWKVWAAKLHDLAESTPVDAEWHLKRYAQEAYAKLVQLRPQLF